MNRNSEKGKPGCDHYKAAIEDGSLVMIPYCACGQALDEDYFCEKCNKKCHCREIFCDNEATLDLIKEYAKKSSQFAGFRIRLGA